MAEMKLGFEETQSPYTSGTQSARLWTERWVRDQMYCPNCGVANINALPNNSPVAISSARPVGRNSDLKVKRASFGPKFLMARFGQNAIDWRQATIPVSFC